MACHNFFVRNDCFSIYFDAIDDKLSDQRLKNLDIKKEKLIPAHQVFKELGL